MIKINKAGKIYIVMTILIGFSAVNTGNNLVYIIASALLSYMLVSGIFGRKNLYGVRVAVEPPEETYAEVDTPVKVKVTNRYRFFPSFLMAVHVEGREIFFPFIEAGGEGQGHVDLRFPNRGYHRLEGVHVSSVFPFNFFTRFRNIPGERKLIVFPRPIRTQLGIEPGSRAQSNGKDTSNTSGHESEILSIRDYMPGDPLKYIDWKSTAKTDALKTRELSSIHLQSVMIDFDALDKKDLEHSIGRVTYLVLNLLKMNVPVGLRIGGEALPPSLSAYHRWNMLQTLALYGKGRDVREAPPGLRHGRSRAAGP